MVPGACYVISARILMAKELDVYRDWLGITETARPPNSYQLLRLKLFEDNPAKIREHYRKMNAHVRKFAAGEFAARSQELLNELARAMLCLTDAERKRDYDASLGRKEGGPGRRHTLEEILLASKAIDPARLDKARNYAKAVGLEVRDALVQQKAVAPDVVMLAYAESVGLPYVELADVGVDEALVPQVPAALARQHACVPVLSDRGQVLMASPNPLPPDVEEELRLRLNMPVRTVLCTAGSINPLITRYYARDPAAAEPARRAGAAKGASKPSKPKFSMPKFSLPSFSFGGGGGGGDDTKRAMLLSVIAFNVTVMVVGLSRVMLHKGAWTALSAIANIAVLAVLGGIAAAVTYRVASRMK
jgi:hypothetical protein